jgi:membrane associated rhomboid family serine protease
LTTLLVILVIGGYALYVMNAEERLKVLRAIEARFWQAKDTATAVRAKDEPFREALRQRTAWPIVTPALAALIVLVFVSMALGSGSFGDPKTLIAWGGNFGPRTTNGEWWRLAAAVFVHGGFLHMLVNVAGLVQVGITLERMLGHLAVAAVFLSAGMFASLESLSAHPIEVSIGASGAIFGVYGLMIATLLWGKLQNASVATSSAQPSENLSLREMLLAPEPAVAPSTPGEADHGSAPLTIPMETLKRMAPPAAIFVLYNVATDGLTTGELSGLVAGFACGLVLARRVGERKAPTYQVAAAMAIAAVIVVASAAMLRGVADVRPEIARVVALEDQTAGAYAKAVTQFKNGAMSAKALASVINQSIVPELQAAHARLKAIKGVPAEHRPLVDGAEEYFRLRDESWRLRSDALHRSNMVALRAADRSERASLEALERLRGVDATQ